MKKSLFDKRKIFLLFFMTTLLVGCIAAANTITLDTPAANGITSTTSQYLNSSLDSNDHSIENISFYYRPVSGTGVWTLIGYTVNTTNAQTTFNSTWDTTSFIDATNYELNATASDITNAHISTDSSTGVKIDNGDPTATWSTSSVTNAMKTGKSVPFTAAIDADNTIGITNCTIFLGSGTAQNMTGSGNACSASYTAEDFGITANGIYNMIIMATDANANSTNTSTRTFEIVTPTSGGGTRHIATIKSDEVIEDTTDEIIPPEKNIIVKMLDKIIDFFKGLFN